MRLKKMSFKNFKSYSNIMTEIVFDDKPSLNLIIGENGTGKTSIAECATYLLYGKLENFIAADIPNRINKAFYGRIELECEGHNIVIERGLNPGLFAVQIDGKTIDTAGKSNVQTMLEETYYKIPYNIFHSTLVLEVGEVKSLLDMNAADKRNIIDKICGFTVFNQFNKFIKDDLKVLNDKLNSNYGSMGSINKSLNMYDRQIEELKSNEVTQTELDELTNQINEAKKQKAANDEILKKISMAKDQLRGVNIQKVGEYNNLRDKISVIDKKIKLIDGGKCPTCGSSLETEEFQKEKEELLEQKNGYLEQIEQLKQLVATSKEKIGKLEVKETETQKENNKIKLVDLQSDYKYKQSMMGKNTSSIESLKEGLVKQLADISKEKEELEKLKEVLDFLAQMMGDGKDSIKRYISGNYIPIINSIMDEMLKYMNLNYVITFNDSFDAEIKQNGMTVKYCTLSRGQKARVDFAAIITFVKFLKLQCCELNLLFLDELFSHVDTNGMNDMIEILRGLCEEMNLDIYLIHHAQLEGVMFDTVMQTKMTDGFSHLEICS
jgi:DNA repair exonuclease SbcCD ATPase subunit